ncbi:hypothetical protein [Rhodoferax sp.]|uniref:hypothetical protein n=1 Tax=Rhodoferax sp. TaxID=50421 RepID=UPI0027316286|nr:hypothetical protein [Rhodoferax sp.]
MRCYELDLYFQMRANAQKPDKVTAGFHLPQTEIVRDAEGTKVVRRTTPTLLERLIARSAGQTLPVPKKRGRPSKKGVTV